MATEVKYRISAEDNTKQGVESARRNTDSMKASADSLNKTLKDGIKPANDLMQTFRQWATLGGTMLIVRQAVQAIGSALDSAASYSKEFAESLAGAREAVAHVKGELGLAVAAIIPFYNAVAELGREYLKLKAAMEAANVKPIQDAMTVLNEHIATVQKRIAEITDLQSKNLIRKEMQLYYTDELENMRRILGMLMTQKSLMQTIAGISGSKQLLANILGTSADAAAMPQTPDLYGSSAWMFGDFIPDREAPGYNQIVSVPAINAMSHLAESLTRFNSEQEIAQTPVGNYYPGAPVPDMEGMAIQGATAGAIDPGMAAFMRTLAELGQGLMGLLDGVVSIKLILDPLSTIFGRMMQILAPAIDDLLAPVVGILGMLGQILAQILLPVIEALTPVIDALAKAFVWLYNNILIPVGTAIGGFFIGLVNIVKSIINGVIWVINLFIKDASKKVQSLDVSWGAVPDLQPITFDDTYALGTAMIEDAGGGYGGYGGGGSASYSTPRIINIAAGGSLITVNTDVITGDDGGLDSFVLLLRDRLARLEAIGY